MYLSHILTQIRVAAENHATSVAIPLSLCAQLPESAIARIRAAAIAADSDEEEEGDKRREGRNRRKVNAYLSFLVAHFLFLFQILNTTHLLTLSLTHKLTPL